MKEISRDFCAKTLAILRHKGMAIGEFEKAVGLSVGTLSRKVNEHGAIELDAAFAAADYFGVTVLDILAFDEKEAERQRKAKRIEELEAQIAKLKAEMEE